MIKKVNTSGGFTLVEFLVAITISLVVLTSVSSAFISQRKAYDIQEQMNQMIQDTRGVMEIITSDLKLAGFDPEKGISGHTDVVGIPYSASQLEIRADLDGDGSAVSTDANEVIIYTFDSTNHEIERNSGQNWDYAKVLAENIQSFSFNYLDADGNTTTTTANIRMVEISITARMDKPDPEYGQNGGYRTYTLKSVVKPPNLDIN